MCSTGRLKATTMATAASPALPWQGSNGMSSSRTTSSSRFRQGVQQLPWCHSRCNRPQLLAHSLQLSLVLCKLRLPSSQLSLLLLLLLSSSQWLREGC